MWAFRKERKKMRGRMKKKVFGKEKFSTGEKSKRTAEEP